MINSVEINKKTNNSVESIEGKKPTYICPETLKRCVYMGGDVPCPDGGLHNCFIGLQWVKDYN